MAAAIVGPDGDPDDVTVIATGGLAPLVLDEASVIDAHEPWLTLIGLRLVFDRNNAHLTRRSVVVVARPVLKMITVP